MAHVCIECRNPQARTDGDSHCLKCGSETVYRSLQYWSPPKKNNLRAWKRIAKGEWLWDRRRVLRAHRKFPYATCERPVSPAHKPGQQPGLRITKRKERSTADLGG